MLNVFVNTWGNYNENGADGGQWITLPLDHEELAEVLENIAKLMGDNDPEWAIHDYEWTTEIDLDEIGEHTNIFTINELCNELDSLEEYEAEEIAAAMEAYGYGIAEALERQQQGRFVFYNGMDLEEVAEELIRGCYDMPELALQYFDYNAFARNLSYDGYCNTRYGVIVRC